MGRPKKNKRGRKPANKKQKEIDDDIEFVVTFQTDEPGQEQDHEVEEQEDDVQEQEREVEEEEHDVHETIQMAEPEHRKDNEAEGEVEETQEPEVATSRKRKRGPTMMRDLAKDPNTRVHVDFTFMGEAYGPGSVKLSSYLGPLVREHVPVTLENWKKLTEEVKTVLWKSVQVTVSYSMTTTLFL